MRQVCSIRSGWIERYSEVALTSEMSTDFNLDVTQTQMSGRNSSFNLCGRSQGSLLMVSGSCSGDCRSHSMLMFNIIFNAMAHGSLQSTSITRVEIRLCFSEFFIKDKFIQSIKNRLMYFLLKFYFASFLASIRLYGGTSKTNLTWICVPRIIFFCHPHPYHDPEHH